MFLLISWQIEFQNVGTIFISSGEQNSPLCIVYCSGFPRDTSHGRTQPNVFCKSFAFLIHQLLLHPLDWIVKHYGRMVLFCFALLLFLFLFWLEGIVIPKSFISNCMHCETKPKMTSFFCWFCSKLLQEKCGIEILYLFVLFLLNASLTLSTLFCPLMTNANYCLQSSSSSPLARSWLKTDFPPVQGAVWTEHLWHWLHSATRHIPIHLQDLLSHHPSSTEILP